MEDMRRIPLYRQTADYARERGELESFRRSNVANIAGPPLRKPSGMALTECACRQA